ncbi:DEAD/DEAH box helicase, partial [Phycicoccus flavus]|uniref:DEAD/DEAH box helicase n=1 Tax=Phycicoccus flavus TaxID=2502783 RepID=UPI00197BB296
MAPDRADRRADLVAEARAGWSRELVDLGGPNTLLWYRDLPTGTLDLTAAHLGARTAVLSGERVRLSELVREPQAFADACRRVERVHDTAAHLESQHGIRTAFLGLGTASWTVVLPNGRVAPREPAAPVFLRSCRTRPEDARRLDWVLEPGAELEVNPALVQYLRSAHDIALDTAHLERLATTGGSVDPYAAYAALAAACQDVPDLSVDPRVVLTTFPSHKVALVADLAAQAETLAGHDVVAALAGVPDALPAVSVGADVGGLAADPDADVTPLDADGSQLEAVAAVRAGSHLDLRTPPGTGASQTVANLVAALAADGRSVLLVSPQRASVEAVRDRLAAAGLEDLLLDLADGGHGRAAVVRDLVTTLDRRVDEARRTTGTSRRTEREDAAARRGRTEAADLLERHLAALHGRREPWGVTLHAVQEEVSRLCLLDPPPRSRVRVAGSGLARLDPDTRDAAADTLVRLAGLAAWDDGGASDPWFGARLADDAEAQEARERVERLAGGLVDETRRTLADVFRGVHLPAAPTVLDWQRVLTTVGQVRDTLEVFRPEVFDIPLRDLVAATARRSERRRAGSDLRVLERWRVRRQARSLLRPGRPPTDLHGALQEADAQRDAWRELAGSGGRPEIPVELDRARLAHDTLLEDLEWLDRHLPDDGSPRLVELDLAALRRRVSTLAAAVPRLGPAPRIRAALDRLATYGLLPLVEDLRARRVPADRVGTETYWVWWCSLADEIGEHDDRVAGHDAQALTAAVETLVRADLDALAARPARIRSAVAEEAAKALRAAPAEEAVLREDATRSGRPRPLPELVRAAPRLATAVRPCWAMSPLAVPSVLPPGELFDVVVVEDASRVSPAEAVPALSRARRVVLVGDPLQLPPAPFTVSAGADAPEDVDGRSVQDVLDGMLPVRTLSWHYRALDERLVSFVRDELYDGRVVTFPGAGRDPVVRHVPVDGVGIAPAGQGAVESTDAEVDRVVGLVLEHARSRPDRSLVVLALSPGHRRRVEEALRGALSRLGPHELAFFNETRPEPFAVREPATVQGQAWDDV